MAPRCQVMLGHDSGAGWRFGYRSSFFQTGCGVSDVRQRTCYVYLRSTFVTVQGATFVPINPGPKAQGKALTQIIGQYNMKHATVIIENSKYADTFLNGVRQVVHIRKQDIFNVLAVDANIGTNALRQKLTDLSSKGVKVIVLHCSPDLMLRVVTVALSTRLYNSGYAWFLSEMAFSRDPDIIAQLPEGLLAINSFWLGGVTDVMVTALNYVISATMCVLKDESSNSDTNVPYNVDRYKRTREKELRSQDLNQETNSVVVSISSLRNTTDFSFYFQRCLRNLVSFRDNSTNVNSNETGTDAVEALPSLKGCIGIDSFDVFPDSSTRHKGPAFNLLNTVDDGMGDRIWAKVGYISASGQRDLKTVLWPGHNIYGPSSSLVKTYRVVTRAAEPFVFINTQVSRREECLVQVPCLQVANSSMSLLNTVVEDFQSDMKHADELYTVHCCKGLALEILETLAVDLNFRYVIYFINDTNYGTMVNNNWTGMVGDVINGAADIIAGAISVTSERMSVMDFTEPFFQNKLSVVVAEGASNVSIWAFLSPFSGQVWLCIFISSIVAGVATSFLEWRSPFGLNPRGRKRTKNYGLGSGLLMVMVLLTGHTINIKTVENMAGVIQNPSRVDQRTVILFLTAEGCRPVDIHYRMQAVYGGQKCVKDNSEELERCLQKDAPKSWPGKVIQNMWAGLAIFIMTSYTANLAAHLAGQSAVTSVKSIYESDLVTKRVAVIPSSAVESFVEKTTPKLSKRAKMSYVDSTLTAINMLRDHTIDIYLDDTPLLEYGLAKYDNDCKVRLAGPGKEFGSEGYAFGLPRHSWLQIPMSNQILWYTEKGYIQELVTKYLARPSCEHFLAGTANPYGLEHTGGLFIILVSAVFISILFLVLEHLAYRYVVPWLRKQPVDSFWKTENLAFISQRVFRVVRSEKLYSQKQAAQEMITIVKQRDFTRLIQKHELQKRRAATQKRVKTKAEVFQDITANIISYHRQLHSTSETAENSCDEGDTEGTEDVRADASDSHQASDLGVSNTAYDSANSGALSPDTVFKTDTTHLTTEDISIHNGNTDAPYSNDVFFKDQNEVERSRRKVVSKSWITPDPHPDLSLPRNGSYILNPSTDRFVVDEPCRRSWNGSTYNSHKLRPGQNNDIKNKFVPSSSVSTSHTKKNEQVEKLPKTDCSNMPLNGSLPPDVSYVHEFPPPSKGNSYYYSSTSSSVQSPSDEQREFSPLSSNTSVNCNIVPGCDDSFEGVSTISPDSSSSWASHESHFADSDSQNLDSLENESQTSSEPLLLNQKPTEASVNPLSLGSSNPNRMSYPSSIYELPTRLSHEKKVPLQKTMSRSQSTGSFSRHASGNTYPDNLECTSNETKSRFADSQVGVSFGNDSEVDISFSDERTNKRHVPVEGASTRLAVMADKRQLKGTQDVNLQQNNTRGTTSCDNTRMKYFTPNLKMKDNRLRSTLRRHAMSGHQNQLSADVIDSYTLDALSKEDVLVLWKKSEIELESRLQEVLARNRRLGHAIDYLTSRERSDESGEV